MNIGNARAPAPLENLVTYCADIGSEARGRFGWAALRGNDVIGGAGSMTDLASSVASDLNRGLPVTLGFECPLFVPITPESTALTMARIGEGQRPWCAAAGASALAVGLTQVVWTLAEIRRQLHQSSTHATLDWPAFAAAGQGLFLWEAFVSGASKGALHTDDATIGARAFNRALPDPRQANAIRTEAVHSLVGAALLRTGWTRDLDVLHTPCLVIRT